MLENFSEVDNKIASDTDSTAFDFGSEYSENLPEILTALDVSIAVTSYQAGKLMLIRHDGEALDIRFTSFHRPMGLCATEQGLTLGVFSHVKHFQREDGLIEKLKQPLARMENDTTVKKVKHEDQNLRGLSEKALAQIDQLYQPVDQRVDACFIERSAHYSGMINIHDIAWGNAGLWAVNSSFSCLCTLQPDYSFVPQWKPWFITNLLPEDRCHLNGMAMRDGEPAFVTTFSQFNERGKWRKHSEPTGTLIDVAANEVLLAGLSMPHSPRWHNGKLYFCNSGLGQVCEYDPYSGGAKVLFELQGFTRGMNFIGDIMVVGLSKTRQSEAAQPAPLVERYDEVFAGLWFLDLQTGRDIAHIKFTGDVDQIYDIAILSDCCFPELIDSQHPRIRNHFCFPSL